MNYDHASLRGCLESPFEPCEPLSLGARHAIRGLAREPTPHQPTHRQVDHGFTARREVLIVFAQAAIPANPGNRAFHHPPARQHREGRHGRRLDIAGIPALAPWAFHDLESPAAFFLYPRAQALAPIGHVGPDVLQPIEGRVCGGQQPGGHVGIPQIGGMDKDTQQETRRLNEEMALAAVEFFGTVIAVAPPFSVVFTVWASMMAAEGCG